MKRDRGYFHLCNMLHTIADCTEGEVRLLDGTDPSNGRVEVCRNGVWGSPCSSHWNISNARVLCRQLGFEYEGIYMH